MLMSRIISRLGIYARLLRLDKPIGIWLLLWPTLWALCIATNNHPSFRMIGIFVCGVIIMRSAGCVINDIADRNFDPYVNRTRNRPLALKLIRLQAACVILIILFLIALYLATLLNAFAFQFACVGAFLACIYPFTKRWTHWPQLVLGVAFAWSVPMVFAAQLNHIPLEGWILFIIAVLWPMAYDTMYAMADVEDDQYLPVKSTALFFKEKSALFIGGLQISMMGLWLILAWLMHWPIEFYGFLAMAALLMIYQQYILNSNPLQAFKNNHWVGCLLWCGIFLCT